MRGLARVIAVGFGVALAGCDSARLDGPKPGEPPLAFAFRPSKVPGQGMVAGIRNESPRETLDGIVVLVSSPGEDSARSHRVDGTLRPDDTITVGWVELDGWKLRAGDELAVRCRQYQAPKAVTVPDP